MPSYKYTEEQIAFIKDLYDKGDTWKQVTKALYLSFGMKTKPELLMALFDRRGIKRRTKQEAGVNKRGKRFR